MTDIAAPAGATPRPPEPAGAGATPAASPSDGGKNAGQLLSSDFDTFLRMMTAQVQNQDPLNPMDSTEFAVQLATFSGVEQQVKTNDLISQLSGTLGASELVRMAGWVGMQARAAVPVLFDGDTPVALDAAPEAGATRAELVVQGSDGTTLERFDIAVEPGPVAWSGRGPEGAPYPAGSYAFDVVSYGENGDVIANSTPETYAVVTEVRAGPEGAEVVFAGGATASAVDITGLRAP